MFFPIRNNHGVVLPYEEIPAAAGSYVPGMMLNFANGKLAPANDPSGRPPYLCVCRATVADGVPITVTPVDMGMVYRCNDVVGEMTLGAAVGIIDGVQVSTNATNKVLQVVAVLDDGSVEVH